ncbi:hypothetical protein J7E97_08310 [Streptomyces sp. ISL-66]|uniref:helix-turn-helix domain-containing protein n=1 Tax=Streptomyces sp. ISL-66 TaxID=2819186 RepID=UPI001BE8BA21|nr:helix-turn-helix domain-containing protein [Streptomyces sp. ISL-66]MBT2467877.1 hypothetical protein [Streptomyces sp. ISL-66]
MNTSTAATEAHVTVATIRTWARRGVIAATKTAGKWVIDATSLARRIAIGTRRKPAKPFALTAEHCTQLGGRRWQKNGMDRIYINDWAAFAGLDVSRYGTGSVCGATFAGHDIANGRAARMLDAIEKVWFDVNDGRLYARHDGADAYEIRYSDGTRNTVDLLARTFAGIKSAAVAL